MLLRCMAYCRMLLLDGCEEGSAGRKAAAAGGELAAAAGTRRRDRDPVEVPREKKDPPNIDVGPKFDFFGSHLLETIGDGFLFFFLPIPFWELQNYMI